MANYKYEYKDNNKFPQLYNVIKEVLDYSFLGDFEAIKQFYYNVYAQANVFEILEDLILLTPIERALLIEYDGATSRENLEITCNVLFGENKYSIDIGRAEINISYSPDESVVEVEAVLSQDGSNIVIDGEILTGFVESSNLKTSKLINYFITSGVNINVIIGAVEKNFDINGKGNIGVSLLQSNIINN